MDNSFTCYGTWNKNCYACLVNCPDKEKCESFTTLDKVMSELNRVKNTENSKAKK